MKKILSVAQFRDQLRGARRLNVASFCTCKRNFCSVFLDMALDLRLPRVGFSLETSGQDLKRLGDRIHDKNMEGNNGSQIFWEDKKAESSNSSL